MYQLSTVSEEQAYLQQQPAQEVVGVQTTTVVDSVSATDSVATIDTSGVYSYILAPRTMVEPVYDDGLIDLTAIFMPAAEGDAVVATDSVATAIDTTHYRQSIFAHHSLQAVHSVEQPRQQSTDYLWVVMPAFVVMLVIGIYFKIHNLRLRQVLHAAVSDSACATLRREAHLQQDYNFLPCLMMFAAAVAVVTVAAVYYGGMLDRMWLNVWNILILIAAVTLLLVLRNVAYGLLGGIFDNAEGVDACVSRAYIMQLAIAVVVIPLCVALPFMEVDGSIIMAVLMLPIVAGFVYNIVNTALIIFRTASVSNFFLFYYLCIVEVVPLLIVYKLLI